MKIDGPLDFVSWTIISSRWTIMMHHSIVPSQYYTVIILVKVDISKSNVPRSSVVPYMLYPICQKINKNIKNVFRQLHCKERVTWYNIRYHCYRQAKQRQKSCLKFWTVLWVLFLQGIEHILLLIIHNTRLRYRINIVCACIDNYQNIT